MEQQKYKFVVNTEDLDAMWNFAEANSVLIKYINKVTGKNSFIYEALMDAETFTAFKISVKLV